MNELTKIIEKLQKNGYFIYDFIYPELNCKEIDVDDYGLAPNHEKVHGHKSLARLLEKHIENGVHIKPTKVNLHLESYKMKLPEQKYEKNSNRFSYSIHIDLEAKTFSPSFKNARITDLVKMYEDITQIFLEFDWKFIDKTQ